MIFRILRTSDDKGHQKPCKNARFVKCCKQYEWSNHKTNYWEIEIDSLEDLMELIKETEAPLIIFGADEEEGPMIEIYDDYRE